MGSVIMALMLFFSLTIIFIIKENYQSAIAKQDESNKKRLICFAVIASDIMLRDGYATTAELNVAKTFIAQHFTESEGRMILRLMKHYLKNGSMLNNARFAELTVTYYTYNERRDMAHILFQIANFHGGICNAEWKTLCYVIHAMALTPEDQRNILSYYQHFATGKEKAENALDGDDFNTKGSDSVENKCLQVLGLNSGATIDEIKDTYRKLVKQYHPDRLPQNLTDTELENATKRFRNIKKAYEKLMEIKS